MAFGYEHNPWTECPQCGSPLSRKGNCDCRGTAPMSLQKPPSRAAEKAEQKRDEERTRRRVYRIVTARDNNICRACGKEANPYAMDMTRAGHHHHIRFRSAGGKDDTSNLMLACAVCHADIHAHRLTVTGDANGVLTFERDGKEVWTS